mgnify:CR=1 FL=1
MNTGPEAKFNLSAWALKNQQMVSFFMLLVIAMGVFCYEKLPRNEDPAFTIKTAVVSAQWPGASVADTTRLLTDTLEKKLQETPWLDYLESETRAGRTVIHVNLRDDTPPQRVPDIWYQVRKKMQDIAPSLPEGVQGPAVDDEFDDTFGTIYAFIPEGFTLREVRDRAETIRRELMSLPDMGKTTLLGEQQEQWVLAFSPARLAGMGLDIQAVADALRAQNAVVPAGTMRTEKENMAIKVSGALTTEESLRAVTLHVNNRYIPLTDIATVTREIAEPPAPAYRVNGKPAIGLAVSMAPTGNMLRFGAALNARMAALSAGLPHGIEMVKVADQSAVVSDAVSGFIRVLIEAVVIVLAVSFVSLGLRAGLVVATAIPLVLAMTFAGMMLAGIGLQRISLGALIIALGLLVDDAMIAVETMVSRLEAGDSRRHAATHAFKTTAFPMLTGTLVMIAGFIPVGFAASSAGEYCFSLFAVVLIALLCSWAVAILFSPLTGTWLLPEKVRHHAAGPGRIARGYGRLLRLALRHRLATVLIALAALGLSAYGTTFMQGEFFPASDRPELLVSLTLPANASQPETLREVEKLEKALAGNGNIDRYSTYVGSGAIRFYLPMDVLLENENIAQMVVVAKDLEARDRLHAQLNRILATQFSDIITRVSPLELGPPVGWPIKYRVSGPDYLQVRALANRLTDAIGRSPFSRDVNQTAGEPERVITLKVNQTAARAAGIRCFVMDLSPGWNLQASRRAIGWAIHVVGDMQLPLKDLSGGAHERGALDAGVLAFAFDGHLDIDAALGVQHREIAHAGHHRRSAGDRARQGEGRGHADGAGDRMRGMAAAGREVARGDAVVVVASADQDRLRDHAGRDVAQPHALAGRQAQPLQPFQQDRVGIQLGRRFPAGHAQVGGAHDHQRHRRVDAAHLDPVDQVDALPGREDRAGHRAPGVQEVQPDGGGGAGHAVDMGLALIGDAPLRRQHGHVDARPGVDVEDADRGLAVLRGDVDTAASDRAWSWLNAALHAR